MVDHEARSDLAGCLNQLVSGEMTNDEFDDAYYGRWMNSKDAAVAKIAGFGYGLYSSDLLTPVRLTGPNAVSEESRQNTEHGISCGDCVNSPVYLRKIEKSHQA